MVICLPNPWGKSRPNLLGQKLSLDEKTWMVNEVIAGRTTARELSNKYSVKRKQVNLMVSRFRKNGNLQENVGRPTLIGSPLMKKVRRVVTEGVHNIITSDFISSVQGYHTQSVMEKSNIAECSVRPLSKRSLGRLIKKMKLKKGMAEQTTDARALATADKLNAVSTAIAHYLMVPLTVPQLIINMDATSFETGGGLTDGVEVIYDPLVQPRDEPLKVPAQKGKSLTKYFVKYYLAINATGISGPAVYVCADENMREGDIDVHEVQGLGVGTDITASGWIVFSKTRSVNEAFYKWWFETMFVKFVSDLRRAYKIDSTVPVYFNLDGEEVQIRPLKTATMRTLFASMNVIVAKPPASTTSISQPCDVGKVFVGAKTKNRKLKEVNDVCEFTMNNTLREVIKKHDEHTGKRFNSHHIKAFVLGIQIVQHILQTTMRKDTIVNSFHKTGQYSKRSGKCSVERILGQCKSQFTVDEVTKVYENLPSLCKIMKERGELLENDYLPLGMNEQLLPGRRGRDELVLNRRRTVFLTHPEVVLREEEKREAKEASAVEKSDKTLKRKADAEARKANPPPKKRAKKVAAVAEVLAENIPL